MGKHKIVKEYLCTCGESDANNFYSGRKTKCKKCELTKHKTNYQHLESVEKARYIKRQTEWASKNIIRVRVLAAKHRAKRKNLDFNIDDDFVNQQLLIQNNRCYYSGAELDMLAIGSDSNQMNPNTLSIDRKDSKKGYIKDNVILVTAIVNNMKNDLSEDYFLSFILAIAKHQGSKI